MNSMMCTNSTMQFVEELIRASFHASSEEAGNIIEAFSQLLDWKESRYPNEEEEEHS